jgi:hypothetical protein
VKRGQAGRLTGRKKHQQRVWFPAQHQERKRMSISTAQVKEIRTEFAKLKPEKLRDSLSIAENSQEKISGGKSGRSSPIHAI